MYICVHVTPMPLARAHTHTRTHTLSLALSCWVCSSVLQCVAACCVSVLKRDLCVAACCNVAVCCSVLQRVA